MAKSKNTCTHLSLAVLAGLILGWGGATLFDGDCKGGYKASHAKKFNKKPEGRQKRLERCVKHNQRSRSVGTGTRERFRKAVESGTITREQAAERFREWQKRAKN